MSATDTDSVLNQALYAFTQTQSVNASIKRVQKFKGSLRESAAAFRYDRSLGASYIYTTPSKLQVLCTDTCLYSIDPEKRQGFRFSASPHNPLQYTDLDPLNRFFVFFSSETAFTFTGSIDSMNIYHHIDTATGKPDISAGIDRYTKRLNLLEFFDTNACMLQQIQFTYSSNQLPEIAVTRSLLGGELLIDSLTIKYKKVDNNLSQNYFTVPDNITWFAAK